MSNTITINLSSKSYNLYVERGLIKKIGENIKKIYNGKKIALVTDNNVNNIYGDTVKNSLVDNNFTVKKIVVPAGEKSKSIEVLLNLYNNLLDFNITRGDLIIALGGGVVGDLTGFAASTILRGVPFIQIPTSLLAQIDSSIGGKVAVDLPRGKNLIGSFFHPEAVFIDPDTLKTLSTEFLHDGMGEVIKYGAIKSSTLFSKLESFKDDADLLNNIDDIIFQCCSIKKDVVEKDERDTGERMKLNFGHTIGHAIEKYFNYSKYSHGEAVSLGMYYITVKSENMGLTEAGSSEKIKNLLLKYDLPFKITGLDKKKILEAISHDKKNNKSNINLILLNKIGDAFIHKIDKSKVKDFI